MEYEVGKAFESQIEEIQLNRQILLMILKKVDPAEHGRLTEAAKK